MPEVTAYSATAGNGQAKQAATGTASSRYGALKVEREPFLVRGRRCAALTIPSLCRPEGDDGSTDLEVPWQNLGSYGVNNLASKEVLSLFPPGLPFFKLKQSKSVLRDLMDLPEDQRGQLKAEIGKALGEVEKEVVECIEEDGDRTVQFDAARHLIVTGNHGLHFYPDSTMRGIPLESYVTVRDKAGNLLEFAIEDALAWETVPEDVQRLCEEAGYEVKTDAKLQQPIKVYTHGRLEAGVWTVYQEAWGKEVPGSRGRFNKDVLPYLFLRMVALKGESYGRSYIEDYEGDLQTLDGNYQIVTEASAAIARFVQAVKPGGVTSKKALAEAPNGAVITGNADDVTTIRADKTGDLNAAWNVIQEVTGRLSKAMLLNSAVQRGGERVTAEEIRYVAKELEDALGGVYSNQVTTWQAPYARLKMAALQRRGRVTTLPKDAVSLTIITGAAALGRGGELMALDQFVGGGLNVLGKDAMATALNPRVYLSRRATALGVDTDGLVYSEEQAQAIMAQQQQTQMQQTLAPELVRQAGGLGTAAINQGGLEAPAQESVAA